MHKVNINLTTPFLWQGPPAWPGHTRGVLDDAVQGRLQPLAPAHQPRALRLGRGGQQTE